MNKKFLAKLLIFCMVFTMLPMAAFAATEETVDGTTYSIAFDTNSATTVVAGGSASVRANVTYANGNDAKGITIAYTVSPEVKGVTVTDAGVVNVAADVAVDTEITVKASATIADKTIDITKGLTVTAPEDVKVENGAITGTLNTDITTDNTKSIYKMGNDTVVIKVENQATVTLASETVNSIAENTKGYKTVIVVTKNADIYLTKSVAQAIQRAYADSTTVTLTVAQTTAPTTAVKAAYNVTFKVGDKEVMPANTTNASLKLVVANPLAADATKVYVYHYADSKYYENGISGVRFTDETPKRVQFTASHFSTIVLTAESQKTDDVIPPGGGGGSSSNVSIATKVTGGKVTVTPTRPTRGQTVTINVTPNEGYKLDTLVVTDNKGNNVELTKVSDNKYTFVMPAGKVTVTPTFVKTDAKEETKDPAAVKRFSDVASGAWYAEYITYVTENALMNGYDDGRFGPNDQTTRAQIVTVLYRLEGEPATRSSNSFSDVSSGGQYYSSAVAWAAINNIVNGYEDGRFGPNDNVTREQIAAILYRYATYKGYDTENAGSIANFSDAAKVSSWANTAISWAVGEELMNGDNGALRPQGNATRAEIAALLMRFCENIAK